MVAENSSSDHVSAFYQVGYKLALENALNLHRGAGLLAESGLWGAACSLNVLAAEEAVKASFLLTKQYNPEAEINDFKKVFRDHKVKHKHLEGLVVVQELHYDRVGPMLEIADRILASAELWPEEQRAPVRATLGAFPEVKAQHDAYKALGISIDDIRKWLDGANDEKNNGFYVDHAEEYWRTPTSFTKDRYQAGERHFLAIVEFVKTMDYVFKDLYSQFKRLTPDTPAD